MATWFSCKRCIGSDPTQDTVKVDSSRFLQGLDKENARPLQATNQQQFAHGAHDEGLSKKREDELRLQQEAREKEKKLQEARLRKEAEEAAIAARVAEEERLQQAEIVERARREAEQAAAIAAAAAAARAAEEERFRQQALEEERVRREREEAEEQERFNEETRLAKAKADTWCKTNGYKDVHTPKSTLRGNKKYPLHTAVKNADIDAITVLLVCGAEKEAQDSKGHTALQLAEKMKAGSLRTKIISALR